MPDRAVLFIDGNNWFHAIRDAGVDDRARLDYRAISLKLLGPRAWVGTRYYIGRVPQRGDARLYAEQRRFLATLEASDSKITTHLGRLEPRTVDSPAAREIQNYLATLTTRIETRVYHDLMQIARNHRHAEVLVEKAVDVMLAVDMVVMAVRNEFDAAYLLSADGDFTPAVAAVQTHGKKVYAASPAQGAQLAAVVDSFIRLKREWFGDCYRAS